VGHPRQPAVSGKGDWLTAGSTFAPRPNYARGRGWRSWRLPARGIARQARLWPLALLALPGVFYIWSMYSSATPIFVPSLWPNSYYNTRYGLAVLPLMAVASAGLVAIVPSRMRAITAALAIAAGTVYWMVNPQPRNWITWEESRVNSEARRAWIREAAGYLAPRYVSGSGITCSAI